MKEVKVDFTLKVFDYTDVVEARKYIRHEVFYGDSEKYLDEGGTKELGDIQFRSDSDITPFGIGFSEDDKEYYSFIAIKVDNI